jgi:hypothetical protein
LRLFPAFFNEIATACSTAFCFVAGWLLPIDPSFSHSCTSVLILLLTTAWLDPFLSGMTFLQSVELHSTKLCHLRGRAPQVALDDRSALMTSPQYDIARGARPMPLFSASQPVHTVRFRTSGKIFFTLAARRN